MKTDELNRELILASMLSAAGAVDLEIFEELPSTNRYLAQKAKTTDRKKSMLVIADSQSAGVGRRGKTWISESGNISMSLLVHFDVPPAKLMGLSLVTGVTVASVIRQVGQIDCRLKWPNDILVAGAKLAGLLIEIPHASYNRCSVITGVGINYRALGQHCNVEQQTASLDGFNLQTSRNELIGKIAAGLLINYESYCTHGLAAFAEHWNALDYLRGKPVSIFQEGRIVDGIAAGIAENGELVVEINGELQSFNSGDVSVRRR